MIKQSDETMKVLFIIRSTAFTNKGGDIIQAVNTAKYLRLLGVEVDVRYSNEIIDYSSYDLLHFFNIIRPADILIHIKNSEKKFVVSTIYVDMSEYEKKVRQGGTSYISKLLPGDTTEYLKVIARSIVNREKISSRSYLWMGQRNAIRTIAEKAACLLPNSVNEYKRFTNAYKINCNYKVVPNGIDEEIFENELLSESKNEDLVICVGRIERRKCQLNLIKALNNTRFNLILIGSPAINEMSYYEECKQISASNISFVQSLPQEELVAYYKKAKVHALVSWFETTGLSSLEAAAMRCNIVITDKGDTREYFGDYAFYCDPASEESIFNAIREASISDFNEELHEKIYQHYTWSQAAKKTLDVYAEVFANSRKTIGTL
jgi:glycosyltransferase involved in cell wall biosynthesis